MYNLLQILKEELLVSSPDRHSSICLTSSRLVHHTASKILEIKINNALIYVIAFQIKIIYLVYP